MGKDELLAAIESEEANCISHYASVLSEQRRKAMDYYYGKPYGNEVEGRSSVVTTEVKDAVEGILPTLMAIFTASDEIVRFEPQNMDDELVAQQATDYANYIFSRLNNGFLALYCLIKDALIQKNGYVKVYWEDYEDQATETYQNLNEMEFYQLMQDAELELTTHADFPDPQPQPPVMTPQGPFQPPPQTLHNAQFKRTKKHGKVCIDPVPPEEVLVSRETPNDLKKSRFVEHRTLKTISQIREMGFKIADDIADYTSEADFNQERFARMSYDDALAYRENDDPQDKTTRQVWLCEAYIRIDFDDDGIAELRKVTKVGKTILDNVEFDGVPIIGGPAILMPHKHYGMSLFDLVGDIQLIKSTVLRQLLDNAYVANNGRMEVLDGMVNMSDLLTSRPNGVVRVKAIGSMKRVDNPLLGAPFYNLLEYLDKVKQNRVGATDFPNAVEPDAINAKAAFVNTFRNAALERINLMARILAEGPVKGIFWKIIELVSKHQDKPKMAKLRGKWVQVDPREWHNRFDMTVTVGIGTGDQHTTLQGAMGVLQIQDGLLKAGLANRVVTESNSYHAAKAYAKAVFPKHADSFFTDPTTLPPAKPQPDPKLLALQLKKDLDQQKIDQRKQKMGMDFLETQQERVDAKQELIASHAHESGMAAREHTHDHIQNERDRQAEAASAHHEAHAQRQHEQRQERDKLAEVLMRGAPLSQKEEEDMSKFTDTISELAGSIQKQSQSQEQANAMLWEMIKNTRESNAQTQQALSELLANANRKVKKVHKVVRNSKGDMDGVETTEIPIH